MDTAFASTLPATPIVFEDALGERRRIDAGGAESLEFLSLRSELTSVPAFEFSLRERASRLAAFRHPGFARVCRIDRLSDPAATLAVISESTRGVRLSTLFPETGPKPVTLDIHVSLHLIRQIVSAVADLHEAGRDVAHGAIGPERIIVTPTAGVVVAEYVLGAALEQLRFSHPRYWREMRIALPASPGLPRFDQRADVTQIGIVALSLILGRLLRDDEYPAAIGEVVGSAWSISARGGLEPLPAGLRTWLWHALQLDARRAFANAVEARAELKKIAGGGQGAHAFSVPLAGATKDAEVRRPPSPPSGFGAPSKPVATKATEATRVEEKEPEMPQATRTGGAWLRVAAAAIVLVALSTAGVVGARRYFAPPPVVVSTGSLSLTSNPPGADVFIDGVARGKTPLTVALNAGRHGLELRGSGDPRSIAVTIAAGAQLAQYIELPVAPVVAAPQPPPAAPAPAGEHAVPVESQFGWVTIAAPVDVQLYENQRLIGTSQSDRIMVSAGRHDIEVVSEALGYRAAKTVQVPPGKVAPIKLEWPRGTMSVNALPWAEVWIDGERIGETPIGNLSLAIGPHEIVFRHPEFGELRHAATVTLNAPARVSVDLRKKP